MISSGRAKVSLFGVTKIAVPWGSSTRATSLSTFRGSGHVLDGLHGQHGSEAAGDKRDRAHVRHDRLPPPAPSAPFRPGRVQRSRGEQAL